jgi:WD40 repeat protein
MDTAVKGAVEISSGVWSGVKALGGMALDAASRSTNSDSGGLKSGFSKSVPSTPSPLRMPGVRKRLSEVFGGGGIPRIDESSQTTVADKGGSFVTVLDLMPLHVSMSSPRKAAEFRWANHPRTNTQGISSLAWNPNATRLAVSGADGLVTRVFSIRPRAAAYEASLAGEKEIEAINAGETVWHMYDLMRGATKADIGELVWEKDGRWAGFGSSNGTIRQYASALPQSWTLICYRCICYKLLWRTTGSLPPFGRPGAQRG